MKNKIIFLGFVLTITNYVLAYPPVDEGKSIFLTRCASCHAINKVLTGPALSGIEQRHSIDWIINFVNSSQTMVKKGDAVAIALFEKFNKIIMPDHPTLTKENIKNIVDYIKLESKPGMEEKNPFARPGKKRPLYQPLSISNYGFFIVYFGAVFALISVLYFAVQLKTFERNKRSGNVSA